MKTLIFAILASLLAAGCASTANVTPQDASAKGSYYYWEHPKLGMVKVDRATNAMITAHAVRETPSQHESRGGSR